MRGNSLAQAIIKHQSPEEREYARYLTEIEVRKRRVADLQANLAAYKEQLGRFNAEYHARVGVLFVELDRIELAIAEYEYRIGQLRTSPHSDPEDLERETKKQFTDQREQINEDEEETRYYEREHRDEQRRPGLDAESEAALKLIFRELAKRFHPDLAKTENERAQREAVMKEVNAAFHKRDLHQLRTIGAMHDVDDTAFEAKSIGEKLVWAIREINRLEELIELIQSERNALKASDVATLWSRQQLGEDVIGQLENELRSRIEAGRELLHSKIKQFRGLVEQHYG